MLGILGIIISLVLIIWSAYKGWHIFPVSLVGSLIIIFCSGMNLWEGLSVNYASGWTSWAGTYFLLFALGALFGEVMSASGAAKAIAYKLSDLIGAKYAPLAIALVTLILTYGGINAFVISFTIYPLAMVMCQEANIPRSLAVAGLVLGSGTAAQAALPGVPSTSNIVPCEILGTATTAAPVIGIVCAVIMIALGAAYILWQQKRYAAKGIGFVAIPQDGLGENTGVRDEVPNLFLSIIPVIAVIVIVFATSALLPAVASVSLALFVGCVLVFLFFWKRIANKKDSINKAFASSISPLMTTAAIIGYGTVVQASPAFQVLVDFVLNIRLNPYVTAAIGANILAGATGSASGGVQIFLNAMGQHFLDLGVNADALHRVTVIAASGLDTLPHNGAILSLMAIFGTNHKESYSHVFVICCAITIFATVVAVIMANMMYPV